MTEVNFLKMEVLFWAPLTSYSGVIGLELSNKLSEKEPILIVVLEVEIDLGLYSILIGLDSGVIIPLKSQAIS